MLFDELNRPTISVFTPSAYKTLFFWRGAFLSIECELHQPFVIEEPTATSLVVDCEIRNFNGIKEKKNGFWWRALRDKHSFRTPRESDNKPQGAPHQQQHSQSYVEELSPSEDIFFLYLIEVTNRTVYRQWCYCSLVNDKGLMKLTSYRRKCSFVKTKSHSVVNTEITGRPNLL